MEDTIPILITLSKWRDPPKPQAAGDRDRRTSYTLEEYRPRASTPAVAPPTEREPAAIMNPARTPHSVHIVTTATRGLYGNTERVAVGVYHTVEEANKAARAIEDGWETTIEDEGLEKDNDEDGLVSVNVYGGEGSEFNVFGIMSETPAAPAIPTAAERPQQGGGTGIYRRRSCASAQTWKDASETALAVESEPVNSHSGDMTQHNYEERGGTFEETLGEDGCISIKIYDAEAEQFNRIVK